MKQRSRLAAVAALVLVLPVMSAAPAAAGDIGARVDKVLAQTPLVDAHNDLPWEVRLRFKGNVSAFDLTSDWSNIPSPPEVDPAQTTGVPLQTDIPRLRAGHVGAQFWSVYVPVGLNPSQTVQMAIEQVDLVNALLPATPPTSKWPTR